MSDWREEMTRQLQKDYDRGYQDGINLLDISDEDLKNDWYMNGHRAGREEWEEVE